MNVERLTKYGYQFSLLNVLQGLTRYTEIDEILNQLAAYEDTGLSPADIATLTARAEAAEARADACKADFEAYTRGSMECCAYCIHDDECEPGESLCYANVCGFEWRGPEAGKGAAPNE